MILQVVKTTDKKHEGRIVEVPEVSYQTAHALGMNPDTIRWFGDTCILQNSNYTIKLKQIGD